MIRKAFKMQVLSGSAVEYERRHNPIWPKMEAMLKAHGVSNYSIFIDDESDTLFAYVELASQEQWDTIAEEPICRKWWVSMAELMETEINKRPFSQDLREVFHLA